MSRSVENRHKNAPGRLKEDEAVDERDKIEIHIEEECAAAAAVSEKRAHCRKQEAKEEEAKRQ